MPPQLADRNLLFGIVALQMDFIDRDQLVAGMNAWVLDKHKPLGQILSEQGALSEGDTEAIESLVRRHLLRHDNDPERSLASMTSIGPVRDALAEVSDPVLQASLRGIASLQRDREETLSYLGSPTVPGGRFRILRPHAQGGLGVVSVAFDEELHREVALKEIQDRYAGESEPRSRFLLEAEITGSLEHPGIVPVYGLGHHPDGRPFYAMRFVRGESLKDAIAGFHGVHESSAAANGAHKASTDSLAHSVQFRRLLARFLDVCNAIAYAHSRGVLHRDIKPGNILLGPFGETLVVDWGLAKVIGREDHASGTSSEATLRPQSASGVGETVAGTAIGTPAYMSPEQADGRLDLLGPATDVYGLGVTLYAVLTGRAPFGGENVGEILLKVRRGEFARPRSVQPSVPRALEAICLQAMALEQSDRYPNPRDLALDIEHWLADEPAAAYREPWPHRLGRWVRKHQTLVTSAAAMLFVAACAALLVAAQRSAHARDIEHKNFDLARTNSALDTERNKAVEREKLAVDAVKRFRDAVIEEPQLKNNAALQGLRKRLLKEPLAFFRSLRERLQADRDTRTESLARLAEASFALGYLTDEIGDKRDALVAFAESLASRERLADANPSVSAFQRDLAITHNNIAILLRDTGKPADALKSHKAALAIRTKLADANPSVTAFQLHLANSHNNIGILLSETGKPADALKSYRGALGILMKLAEANPSVSEFQSELARSHRYIGSLLLATGKPADALKSYQAALAICTKLADANAFDTAFQHDLAESHNNIGLLLGENGKPADARKSYEAALAIQTKLADANPSVSKFQVDLATSQTNLGDLLSATGKPAEALKSYEAALAIQTKLVDANPSVSKFQRDLRRSHNNIGALLSATGKHAEALKSYEAALVIQTKLAEANPSDSEFQRDLARSHNSIGVLLSATGKPADALKSFAAALAIQAKLADANPSFSGFQSDLARSHNNIGTVLSQTGKPADALKSYQAALAIQTKLADANPSDSAFRNELALSHYNIGKLLRRIGKPADALTSFAAALAIQAKLADASPAVSAFQSDLARTHYNLGNLLRETGKPADAMKSSQAALAILAKLALANPSVIEFQRELANSHNNLGLLLRETGKPAEALKSYESALAIQTKLAEANPSVSTCQRDLAGTQHDIGLVLRATGKPAEALKSFQAALAVQTKLAESNPSVILYQSDRANSHDNIGLLLRETGKPADALKSSEAALAIRQKLVRDHPESPDFASQLGGSLHNVALIDMNANRFAAARDRLRQAVEFQRTALASNPAHPSYRQFMANHLNALIVATRALGDLKFLALVERQLLELRETDPALVAVDARLRAMVSGEQQPKDVAERLQLAQRAYDLTRYAAAARLWHDALEADRRLGADRRIQHRYNAACAAALAGCGQGKNDPPPSDDQRTKLRQQALDWLTVELGVWAKLLEAAKEAQRRFIVETLKHWREDTDLAGIRDSTELAKLPETERAAFRKLWADVDGLLKKASQQ
jgi:serine/threonine-protein kinase